MFGWIKKLTSGWVNWSPGNDRWYRPWGGVETQAGTNVDENLAMQFSTVYACVAKLSKTMATLPVHVYERVSDNERQPIDHPLNEILTYKANPDATGLTLMETMMANVLLWGVAFAEVIRLGDRSTIKWLIPIPSCDITIKRTTDLGELYFEQRLPGGGKKQIAQEDMLFISGLSLNGVVGLSPIGYQREAIGLGIAASEMSGSFYKNGCWTGGFIQRDPDKVAGKLDPDKAQKMIDDLNKQVQGSKKAFGLALLREGMTYKGIDIPLKDAELLASRRFQRIEICGIFDVPPTKIQDLTEGKFNNVAQQDTAWAKDSLVPWASRFEAAIRSQLLTGNQYIKYNMAGLMRGDFKSQMEAFTKGFQSGFYSINEVRQSLEMNPIEDGDIHYVPLNMIPVGEPREPQLRLPAPTNKDDDQAGPTATVSADYFKPLIDDAAQRIATKEIKAVGNALKRLDTTGDTDKFQAWLDKFYTDHVVFSAACLSPIAESFEKTFGCQWNSTPLSIAGFYADNSISMLKDTGDDSLEMDGILGGWEKTQATAIAESVLEVVKQSTPESTLSVKEIKS